MAPAAEPPPASMASTNTTFRIDGKGELVLDADTRLKLEMLAANLPASPTRHELQTIEATALAGLPQQAAQKASRILDAYIRYAKAEAELNAGFAEGAAVPPQVMLDKLVELRRQHLGTQVADALFGAQEMRERYGMQLALLESDPKLNAQQKLERIEALQRALPDDAADLKADLEGSRSALMMDQEIARMRQQGASDEQIRQVREQHVGPDAARELEEMEQHKFDWERRQQAFAQQRTMIAQMLISEQQKQERVEALLRQFYSEDEIPAARAYHQGQAGK